MGQSRGGGVRGVRRIEEGKQGSPVKRRGCAL